MLFPPTLVYSWDSKTPSEDLSNIINGLSMASSTSVNWEIEILLKFAKVQKTNNSSAEGSRGIQSGGAKSSASYFIRQPDIGVCCIITKDRSSSEGNVIACSDADVEIKYSNYIHRSLWRASGQRFFVGSCLISVGFIEHAGSTVKPCMEISYCPTEGDSDLDEITERTVEELDAITFMIHKVAIDILQANTASHATPLLTKFSSVSGESKNSDILISSVGDRARHWLALVA